MSNKVSVAAINKALAKKYDGKLTIEKGETIYFVYDDEEKKIFVTESQWGYYYLNQASKERWLEHADQFDENLVVEEICRSEELAYSDGPIRFKLTKG